MATVYLKDKKKLKGIRGMLLAVTAINALLSIIFVYIASFTDVEGLQYLFALTTGLGAYVIPIMIYARRNGVNAETAAERFYLRPCRWQEMFIAVLLGAGCQFAVVVVNLPLSGLFHTASVYMPKSVGELGVAVFVIAMLPAVFEEFLFRGIVYGSLAEFNTAAAAIFSSVMFAVMHGDPFGVPGYLLLGFVLVFTVGRTGSLYAAMLVHFGNNSVALLLAYFNDILWYSPEATIAVFALGLICFVVFLALLAGVTKKSAGVRKMRTATLLEQNFASLPVLLCVAITAAVEVLIRVI